MSVGLHSGRPDPAPCDVFVHLYPDQAVSNPRRSFGLLFGGETGNRGAASCCGGPREIRIGVARLLRASCGVPPLAEFAPSKVPSNIVN